MFMKSNSLTDASGLDLGDITLSEHCYDSMFIDCTALANAPKLSAKTLAGYCYCKMFSYCSSLRRVDLPATAFADNCYYSMLDNCNASDLEIHYPASVESDTTFTTMYRSPKFGASAATVLFDL